LGKIKRFNEKSIDYCLEKDFLSKETPGPGQYNYKDNFLKGKYNLGKINPPSKEWVQVSTDIMVGNSDIQRLKIKH